MEPDSHVAVEHGAAHVEFDGAGQVVGTELVGASDERFLDTDSAVGRRDGGDGVVVHELGDVAGAEGQDEAPIRL